tara:strand:- start:6375 stop:6518 length:144 start_codon:yes stop_codon:yes gene_type:complete
MQRPGVTDTKKKVGTNNPSRLNFIGFSFFSANILLFAVDIEGLLIKY